jgi:hypothetical protein
MQMMSWIKIIKEEEADDALERAYEAVGAARGRAANIP